MDRCKECGNPLCYNKTIFAAYGMLYCSETCCRKNTEDFEGSAEEITPSSAGIMPHRKFKITGVDRCGKRFKPIYTNYPKFFNVWQGTVWHTLPDGKIKKAYDIIN